MSDNPVPQWISSFTFWCMYFKTIFYAYFSIYSVLFDMLISWGIL